MSTHSRNGRLGALASWANTPDRSARTRNARANSPAHLDWHVARQTGALADAPMTDRLKAAESARTLHFATLAAKSAKARKAVAA
jgi:hypothetical protein